MRRGKEFGKCFLCFFRLIVFFVKFGSGRGVLMAGCAGDCWCFSFYNSERQSMPKAKKKKG